ncbi:MAG: hypothetical protein EOO22_20215 [Comamonadaceae bacterium]|nr:MAG: hypothetical protein EOO22_20215 [Comamonadaceae bacterium]
MKTERIRAVWETELERLELEVISVERLIRGLDATPLEPWVPPAVLGAMPVDLAARAQDLLARQRVAAKALTSALEQAQKQVQYAGRVIDITGRMPEPIYFDAQA